MSLFFVADISSWDAVNHKCSIMVSGSQYFKPTANLKKEQEQIYICEAIKSHRDPSQVKMLIIIAWIILILKYISSFAMS